MSKTKKYQLIGLLFVILLITGCPSGEHISGSVLSKSNQYISDMVSCQENEYYFATRGEFNSNSINIFNFSKEKQKIQKVMMFDLNNSNDIIFSHIFCDKNFTTNNKLYLATKYPNKRVEINLNTKKVKINKQQKDSFEINPFETFSCNTFSLNSEYSDDSNISYFYEEDRLENSKPYCFYENRLNNERIDYTPLPSRNKILQSIEENTSKGEFDYRFDIYPYVQNQQWDRKSLILFVKGEGSKNGYLLLLRYEDNEWKNIDHYKIDNSFALLHTTSSTPIYISNVKYYRFNKYYVGSLTTMPMMLNPYSISIENSKIKTMPLKDSLSKNMNYPKITNRVFNQIQGKNSHNYNITPTLDKDGSLFFIYMVENGLKVEFYSSKSETPNEPMVYYINEKVW